MFWVDELVEEILKKYPEQKEFIIRDEKTLSGRVHVGSLRGVVIHGLVAQALNEKGRKARFLFEFNDADPMDGLPIYLDAAEYAQHMGKPLKDVPSPEAGFRDYPTYFGEEFLKVIHKIGFQPEIVRASEQYEKGTYDAWIEKALVNKEKIRTIYREVSGSQKPEDWFPLQVVCEKCGKVGTTQVTGFDGSGVDMRVTYHCVPNMVKWATGCDYRGECSPFGGRGKLPWKVEWPAKWLGYSVTIEGAGMDHCAAGGSHDVGERICREAFGAEPPFNIPYGFLLLEGAKMSSSKGKGATAHEMSEVLPPELLRLLLTRTQTRTAINFTPDGDTIPRLFDDYDTLSRVWFGKEEGIDDMKRQFHFSQIHAEKEPVEHFLPRFSRVCFMVQIPHLDVYEECEKLKGSPLNDDDRAEIAMRSEYAKIWLEQYASEAHKFVIQYDEVPSGAAGLSDEQKKFLNDVAGILETFEGKGEELHAKIHELRKASTLAARDGFSAIYWALIGKDSGPQAGWFLEALDPKFVVQRFREVAKMAFVVQKIVGAVDSKFLNVGADVAAIFPALKFGVAMIDGVSVKNSNEKLEVLKLETVKSLNVAALKKNSPIFEEYKQMFKLFGVDPTKKKPSSSGLIDRLAYGKDVPTVNTVVDACAVISLKHQVSCHAYDADKLTLPLTLTFAKSGDVFHAIGEDKPKPISKGELIYKDANGVIVSQDYNYRDSEVVKVGESTKNLLVLIDGNAATDSKLVGDALADLCTTITAYSSGKVGESLVVPE